MNNLLQEPQVLIADPLGNIILRHQLPEKVEQQAAFERSTNKKPLMGRARLIAQVFFKAHTPKKKDGKIFVLASNKCSGLNSI